MSGAFMAYTWALSLIAAFVAVSVLRAPKMLGLILGTLLAQGLMFAGGHWAGLAFGPVINFGGTDSFVLVNIIMALIGGFLGAGLARLIRKPR